MKLPTIFQHYAEHQQENGQLSFIEFLDIHYMHGSPKDKDYDRDMQLPFKTTGDCVSFFVNAFDHANVQFAIVVPLILVESKKAAPTDPFISASYLSKIWQPPKSV